jgi:hypothetical protein
MAFPAMIVAPSPNRSSWTRGAVALILAPLLASVPAGLLLGMGYPSALALEDGPLDMARGLFALAPLLIRVTLMAGLPTWLLLRLIRRESALIYGAAGALEALGFAVAISYGFTDGVRLDQLPSIAEACITGALTATLFWAIARQPEMSAP